MYRRWRACPCGVAAKRRLVVMRASTSVVAKATDQAEQHLTFRLRTKDYAIDVHHVHEIKGYSVITPIPNAPFYMKGVMNLRGTIIPVVDLRDRFGMPPVIYDK